MTASCCPRCGVALASATTADGLCAGCLLTSALASEREPEAGGDDEPLTTLSAGSSLGPYRIIRLLGRGGMATVYAAHDAQLDRTIALKVLPPEFLHDVEFSRRFEREARVIASLEHPNIVPIYATGIDNETPWMSMRLLAGGSLGESFAKGRLEPRHLVRILRDVAAAIDYAHGRGIVHRDIKPTNILLDGAGHACVADFGLAQMLDGGAASLTRPGLMVGTPQYMAPEQALGKAVDQGCDIYSLGIVAYEMFAGRTPYDAESPIAVLLQHVNDPLPENANGLVPHPILCAIHKAVAKNPRERWGSSVEFVEALEASVAAGLNPPGRHQPTRISRSHALAVAVLLTALAGWFAFREPGRPVVSVPPTIAAPAGVVSPPFPSSPLPEAVVTPTVTATATELPQGAVTRPTVADIKAAATPASAQLPEAGELENVQRTDPATKEATQPVQKPPDDVPVSEPTTSSSPASPVADIMTSPVRVRTVSPGYPDVARAAQIEGDVRLQALVMPDGKVRDVTVVGSIHPLLDDAARKAVMQYEYTPGRRNGIPEPTAIRITVSFRMR